MRRDEDSEEEVFERRRKIQKKEEEVQGKKDEIEDLFAEETSDTHEEEETEDEPVRWTLGSAGSTDTLREVFGDGSEYAGVLAALAGARSSDVSGRSACTTPSSSPGAHRRAGTAFSRPLCDAPLGDSAGDGSRARLAARVRQMFPTFPAAAVDAALDAESSSRSGEGWVAAASELFPHMDTAHKKTALLQIEEAARAHRDTEKARAWAAHALAGMDTTLARFARSALDALGSAEECARAVPWAQSEKERGLAARRGEMALSAKIAGVSWPEKTEEAAEEDQGKTEPYVARSNPWLFRAVLDVALAEYKLEVWSAPDAAPVSLAAHFPGTPLVLRMLERRGVRWGVRLDAAQIAEKAADDWCADPEEAQVLQAFAQQTEKELARAAQREIVRRAERHVQGTVFERVLALAGMHAGRQEVTAAWVARGRVRCARADKHGGKPERVEELGEEDLRREGVLAVTGTGSRVRALLQRKNSVYVPEGVVAPSGAHAGTDLSAALCGFVKHPLLGLQRALAAEKPLPGLVALESLLSADAVRAAWRHALWVAQAQKEVAGSTEFGALRKHLLEYLKSGGSVEALPVGVGATAEDARRAVRSAAVPHTGWRDPGAGAGAESPVLQLAYQRCLARLRGEAVLPAPLGAREEFAAAAGVSEAEIFGLETRWAVSSACTVSLPGKIAEGVVCRTAPECVVQLESGVFAVLERGRGAGPGAGQRVRVQVLNADIAQHRVTAREVEALQGAGLRDAEHWRVKKASIGSAVHALRAKPLGAHMFRMSATHRDSLVLTVRMTEYPDECVCAHLRVRERPEGYEVERRMYADLDAVASEFLPAYTRVLRQVVAHPRFSMSSVESMKQAVARGTVPCAFSISRTTNSCVSYVRPQASASATEASGEADKSAQQGAEEILLYVTDRGLIARGKLFPTLDSVCAPGALP